MAPAETEGPECVAIVAMGVSAGTYQQIAAASGGRPEQFDEVWAVNAMAGVIFHDRAFVMDDVRHELRAQASEDPPRAVAQGILRWLPQHPGPVLTSTAYPEYPALVEYPLQEVLQAVGGVPYLNNTVAYAVAYAIWRRVKRLFLFGCDFTYPDRRVMEAGRACTEYLLGIAVARGVEVSVPDTTTLLDAHKDPNRRLYGYHEPVRAEIDAKSGRLTLLRGDECSSSATKSS